MRLSKQLYQSKLQVPCNLEEIEIYKLLQIAGFVDFPYSGFPQFMPLGQKIINEICRILRTKAECFGFSEVYLPLVQHRQFLEQSGRLKLFEREIFFLAQNSSSYMLSPTNEEFLLNITLKGIDSYRQFPIRLFQIADKFRDIQRPRGLMRSKQFMMCDMCSIDSTRSSLQDSVDRFESTVQAVFKELGLKTHRLQKNNGEYVDYMIICSDGETKVVMSSDGSYTYSDVDQSKPSDLRASSLAMYFLFQVPDYVRESALNRLGLSDLLMGTYGFGIQRCLHGIVQQHIDKLGINFPKSIRPFNVSIIPVDPRDEDQISSAAGLYEIFLREGLNPVLDDRFSLMMKEKAAYSDFLGVPIKVFIGKSEVNDQELTIKSRGDAFGQKVDRDDFISHFWNYAY